MPQIPNLPPHLAQFKGVEMTPPPPSIRDAATKMITDLTQGMRDEEKFMFTWIAQRDGAGNTSVNLAAVQRVGDHVQVVEWFGKTWGEPYEVGIAGKISFD